MALFDLQVNQRPESEAVRFNAIKSWLNLNYEYAAIRYLQHSK